MEEWLEVLLKLFIALGASGLIGLEREITGHKAGIRTQILVGIGSTSLVMIGIYNGMKVDEVGRIIAGIATGLGFLGAGAIMKEGLNVKGLTTAATIWVNAAIGASIGMGSYLIGISTLVMTLMVLTVFAIIERVLHIKPSGGTFVVTLAKGEKAAIRMIRMMEDRGVVVRSVDLDTSGDDNILRFDIDLKRRMRVSRLIEDVNKVKGVKEIRWEDAEHGLVPGMLKVN